MGSIAPVVVTALAAVLLEATPAAAQLPVPLPTPPLPVPTPPGQGPDPDPYQANDGRGFRDVLPPGTRGLNSGPELAGFLATGRTVPHCCDQLSMYGDLVYAAPGLAASDIPRFFKDSSFGVREGDVKRRYSPRRSDVTIVRDKGFGVPHVYGRNRDGAMFGRRQEGGTHRSSRRWAARPSGRSAARWRSTTPPTTTATTSAPPTRAAGTATCARTCAPCSSAR